MFNRNRSKVYLVPVPSSKKHIRMRGFDHIKNITSELTKIIDINQANIIERVGNLTQVGSSVDDRKIQASKSYKIKGNINKDGIYLIVDDVKTTGSTLQSVAKLLKQSGVKEIWAIYILRQII